MQKELLFLAHRIPFPPNKGDKIRSFNLLKHLAKTHTVHLGAFVDDPHDWSYQSNVSEMCEEVFLQNLNPRHRKLASLKGLLTGESLTIPYYANADMQRWVDKIMARPGLDRVVVFSSPMTQFVAGNTHADKSRIADFVDIDSDKWAQYARSKSWPMNWVYRREARTLLAYERKIAAEFDATVFVSEHESDLFKQLAPESAERSFAAHNGVDTDYFSPEHTLPNPYNENEKVLIFTGAMDYWANEEAVSGFANDIFPHVLNQLPNAVFYIVGGKPTPAVQALGKLPGVTVTGAVEDIRPYIGHASLSVAPMNIARGVQNKVLEAMAMAVPVLASPEAAEGIVATSGKEFMVEKGVDNFISRAVEMLTHSYDHMAVTGRDCVLNHYSWAHNLSQFDRLLLASQGVAVAATASVQLNDENKIITDE